MIVTASRSVEGRRIAVWRGIVRPGACAHSLAGVRQTRPAVTADSAREAGADAVVGAGRDAAAIDGMPAAGATGTAVRLG